MSSPSTPSRTALVETAADGAAKKVGERIGERATDRALNAIIDFVKNKYGKAQVQIGLVFDRYLDNAAQRYNQIRTLATGTAPRSIIGEGNLYVQIGLNYNGEEIDTSSVDPLLQISNNLLILGTGGVGKSMLTRYLFLDTAKYGEYVPVLIELRRIGGQSSGQLSILDLIYTCMKDFDVELPREQFEYSLQFGKYLFLFDGFDEVKSFLAKEAADAIQKFSAKYPKNSFIVTSRPRAETSPLETFTILKSMPLNKAQAIDLASRIWTQDEKTTEFCQQLDAVLYEKHRDFAENPLLLSMMFLTFMRNSSIPDHLSDFYKKAYDALYSAHDNQDKGCYKRDFECKSLDENEFREILSHFCFHSYFKEAYEFSEAEIIRSLQASLQKLGFHDVKAADYLMDLRNVVCMIIKDGDSYRFSHRSFQTYFAACYTAHTLTDEQQKRLFSEILLDIDTCFEKQDYYTLLMQIESERFTENALENGLRRLMQDAGAFPYPDEFLLKAGYMGIEVRPAPLNEQSNTKRQVFFRVNDKDNNCYNFNILALFMNYWGFAYYSLDGLLSDQYCSNVQVVQSYADQIRGDGSPEAPDLDDTLSFEEIDMSARITGDERHQLYCMIVECRWSGGIFAPISQWLDKLDAKRASLKSPSFIDDL